MIEEIKKEIEKESYNENFYTKVIQLEDLFKILDKYKDKEIKFDDRTSKYAIVKVPEYTNKYKKCWEELKDLHLKTKGLLANKEINSSDIIVYNEMLELEQKHNIDTE